MDEAAPPRYRAIAVGWSYSFRTADLMEAALAIQDKEVTRVLLADGIHEVADGSFERGPYAWQETEEQSDEILNGFRFIERGQGTVHGPMTSILAVWTETPRSPNAVS